jgi:hypothetical protein
MVWRERFSAVTWRHVGANASGHDHGHHGNLSGSKPIAPFCAPSRRPSGWRELVVGPAVRGLSAKRQPYIGGRLALTPWRLTRRVALPCVEV